MFIVVGALVRTGALDWITPGGARTPAGGPATVAGVDGADACWRFGLHEQHARGRGDDPGLRAAGASS